MNDDKPDVPDPCVPILTSTRASDICSSHHLQHATFFEDYNTVTVSIDKNGVELLGEADITINGKSLKNFIKEIEERLLILHEDSEKHELYPALKTAYEQYKLIEKLVCSGQENKSASR